ncbi:hypothetical protein NIES22_10110 [Calothrix brevissima NIES-22]|nr:hypothetical protein NIES22_10110 [Calothrix brevissima NIES-22]
MQFSRELAYKHSALNSGYGLGKKLGAGLAIWSLPAPTQLLMEFNIIFCEIVYLIAIAIRV